MVDTGILGDTSEDIEIATLALEVLKSASVSNTIITEDLILWANKYLAAFFKDEIIEEESEAPEQDVD